MPKISKHFNWEEFFVSKEYPNLALETYREFQKDKLFKDRITHLCNLVLEPIRIAHARPVIILSGIRNKNLNNRVGGKDGSDHTAALACDISIPGADLLEVFKWAREKTCHKTLIYYPNQKLIHCSINWPGVPYSHAEFFRIGSEYIPAENYLKKGDDL